MRSTLSFRAGPTWPKIGLQSKLAPVTPSRIVYFKTLKIAISRNPLLRRTSVAGEPFRQNLLNKIALGSFAPALDVTHSSML
jgi:hypothetical protein